jgi:L-ascorbate metabolism protein UlaG (beta-lactamase superfamily)
MYPAMVNRMKVTKWPQSCLVFEKAEGRICIDPGGLSLSSYGVEELGTLDAVLYTHRHPDHLDEHAVDDFLDRGVAVYGNADVCQLLGNRAVNEVGDEAGFEAGGFAVVARSLTHAPMVDGSPGPPNTGYLIDERVFHPGDGIDLPGLRADVLAVPITGPSISFRDAYQFVRETGARTAIPVHYDGFIADPDLFARVCDIAQVVVLGHGETIDV